MAHPVFIKERAIKLRIKGYSLNEIKEKLSLPKSLLSGWLRDVPLSSAAVRRLDTKIRKGRTLAAERKKMGTRLKIESYLARATDELNQLKLDKISIRLLCSLIYYCEGRKSLYEGVAFTNSDSRLVQIFLALLRSGFLIDEQKFRVCVHLHEYHDKKEVLFFWSKVTRIPLSQFIRPFKKVNTGKRVRIGYNGCAAISYHDTNMARELLTMAEAFFNGYGPIS